MRKTGKILGLVCLISVFLSGCGARLVSSPEQDNPVQKKNDKSCTEDRDMVCEKPVIYLYGYENVKVDVGLNFDGELTCVYPEMTNNKWSVMAQKGGTLKKGDRKYNYLYWEGRSNAKYDFSTGYCIEGEKTVAFLEETLSLLGLTDKEANEFIIYWLPKMQNNKYNVISFQGKAYTDIAKLDVRPAPSKYIRVFMAWYPSETKVDIKAPKVPTTPGRKAGETILVEWGGVEVDDSTYVAMEDTSGGGNIIDALAGLSQEDLQHTLNQVVEARKDNGGGLMAINNVRGHDYTDKNGNKYTFTEEEWNFLLNTWAYTGQPNSVIAQFTIDELKTYIKNNMKK